jgi:preprotein translocase subunit SecD
MVFDQTGERFYLHDEVLVDQSDVESASVVDNRGHSAVELVLTSVGTKKFEKLTEGNVGKQCGMILNGQLVSAPRIMGPIRSGRAIIMSDFTEAEARRIAEGLSRSHGGGD